jgi:hypothetical protein
MLRKTENERDDTPCCICSKNLMLDHVWTSCNARNVGHGIASHAALPTLGLLNPTFVYHRPKSQR